VLADALGVGRTRVSLERGATARLKVVSADGVERAGLLERWPGLVVEEH
jgi:uncharacterized protein YggU (UPF0235/DUF167 family)